MSEAEDSLAPRRSQRERKQASQYVPSEHIFHPSKKHVAYVSTGTNAKRKRVNANTDDDDANSDLTELESSDTEVEDNGEDYNDPKPKAKATAKRNPKASGLVKKIRATKSKEPSTNSTSTKKTRARRPKESTTNGQVDPSRLAQETKIAGDNSLFSMAFFSCDPPI